MKKRFFIFFPFLSSFGKIIIKLFLNFWVQSDFLQTQHTLKNLVMKLFAMDISSLLTAFFLF